MDYGPQDIIDTWVMSSNPEVKLILRGFPDTTLPAIPEGVVHVVIQNNPNLTTTPTMSSSVRILDCQYNPNLTSLAGLNDGLLKVYANGCNLGDLSDPIPSSVEELWLNNSGLTALPNPLPSKLKILFANDNQLTSVPDNLSSCLTTFVYHNNQITAPPLLPASLVYIMADPPPVPNY